MSEVGILGNTAQHSEFRYKKTSVSVNPKYKERKKTQTKKKHSLQMQGEKFKNTLRLNLQRRWIFTEVMRGGILPKSSLPVS